MTENQQSPETQLSPSSEEPKSTADKIRLRAIVIGSGLALLICLITPFNNAYRQGTPLAGGHFPLVRDWRLLPA